MKSIFDEGFKYTPAIKTDIRESFERARRRLEEERQRSESLIQEAERIVAKTRIKGKAA